MLGRVLCLAAVLGLGLAFGPADAGPDPTPSARRSLEAFRSDDQLRRYLKYLAGQKAEGDKTKPGTMPAAMAMPAPANALETVTLTGARASDSITNNQEVGVDEGDIVKARGDLLIILRRGRLFTVSLADGGLKPIDRIDAYPPGVDPRGDWYDEMLIAGDRIVVIGYSYARGGTQVNRFRVDRQGHLSFEDAYALKSSDYYSARNYASRLIGMTLIIYSPHYLPWRGDDPALVLPSLRRWGGAAFEPIGSARDVFLSPGVEPRNIDTVHSVTRCDLTAPVLSCKGVSVLGPSGRVFYVSPSAVYVWVTSRSRDGSNSTRSMVYRLPLDGSAPAALRAHGAPVDQFSFREGRNALDVLVRADSVGEAMWEAERSRGDIALLHIPFAAFGDGSDALPLSKYRPLPQPVGSYYSFHNRFIGDYVLYGEGNGWGAPKGYRGEVTVVALKGGAPVKLSLPHGVDRLEAMGRDAVVVGSDGANLHFTAVALRAANPPQLAGVFVLAGAAQAESRSHGFFYKPEDDDSGVIGLPVSRPAAAMYHQLLREAASVVFVRRDAHALGLLGELPSRPETARDDACKASCVDWYGNARPIFYGGRSFALMGYEIVEGVLRDKDMLEKARANFAPDPGLLPARN